MKKSTSGTGEAPCPHLHTVLHSLFFPVSTQYYQCSGFLSYRVLILLKIWLTRQLRASKQSVLTYLLSKGMKDKETSNRSISSEDLFPECRSPDEMGRRYRLRIEHPNNEHPLKRGYTQYGKAA